MTGTTHPAPHRLAARLAQAALLLCCAVTAQAQLAPASGEAGAAPPASAVAPPPAAEPQPPRAQARTATPAQPRREARPQASGASPAWSELSAAQQQALAPLQGTWPKLSAARKRKWLALSRNIAGMPEQERALLHSRMREWATLTPQQRTQARLNFGESKQLPAADKKALWEAYQALPPDEKRKLAAGAAAAKPAAPPTAAAVQPQPTPLRGAAGTGAAKARPRIAASPDQLDHNTLLPQPGAAQRN